MKENVSFVNYCKYTIYPIYYSLCEESKSFTLIVLQLKLIPTNTHCSSFEKVKLTLLLVIAPAIKGATNPVMFPNVFVNPRSVPA